MKLLFLNSLRFAPIVISTKCSRFRTNPNTVATYLILFFILKTKREWSGSEAGVKLFPRYEFSIQVTRKSSQHNIPFIIYFYDFIGQKINKYYILYHFSQFSTYFFHTNNVFAAYKKCCAMEKRENLASKELSIIWRQKKSS